MGSKAREGAKAMSLAFVMLDFQHAGVKEERSTRDENHLNVPLIMRCTDA